MRYHNTTADDSASETNQSSRRRFLLATGTIGASALAGCTGRDLSGSSGGGESGSNGSGGGNTVGNSSSGNGQQGNRVVNVLTWEGYGEDSIVKEFEKEHNATVNIKLVSSDPQAFNILQSGGVDQFDVLTVNNTWAQRNARAGTIESFSPDNFPATKNFLKSFQWPFEPFKHQNEMYGLPTRWGWDTMTINSNEVPKEHVSSYDVLWTGGPDGQYENKIGIMDWPTWNIPKIALTLGYPPFEQNEKQLADIKEKLVQMFSNMKAVYTGTSAIRQAFLQNDIVLSPVGNFTMSELRAQGKEWVNVTLPEAGGMGWTEGICMVKNPQNRKLALEFMKRVITPNGQFALAWKPSAKSPPVNTASFDKFNKKQQDALMFNDAGFKAADTILEKTTPYEFSPITDKWTDMWTEAKARSGV